MTQALAGFNERGIVLATDSRATRFDPGGQPEIFQVKKLFPLGPARGDPERRGGGKRAVIVEPAGATGAAAGTLGMGGAGGIRPVLSLRGQLPPLEEHGPEAEGFRRMYFILAGWLAGQAAAGFFPIAVGE